jgi:hypothetical protein
MSFFGHENLKKEEMRKNLATKKLQLLQEAKTSLNLKFRTGFKKRSQFNSSSQMTLEILIQLWFSHELEIGFQLPAMP